MLTQPSLYGSVVSFASSIMPVVVSKMTSSVPPEDVSTSVSDMSCSIFSRSDQ